MRVETQTDPVLRRRVGSAAAIIPVGSTEQHGPHLPVSTDSDLVTAVARGVGAGRRYLVMPTVTVGVSFEHAPFFNVSVRASTLGLVLGDMCRSLYSNGIKRVFVINGHYGNKKALARFAAKERGEAPAVHVFSYWEYLGDRFDHAGFMETSLMLAVSGRVRMSMAQKGLDTDGMTEAEVRNAKKVAARSFPEATGNGVWGNPRLATAEEGRRMLDTIIRNLRKECQRHAA